MRHNYRTILLAVLLLLAFVCPAVTEARIYIVSAGIADYPGTENDLSLPVKDAETIQWLFQKNSQCSVRLLRNSEATVEGVQQALRTHFAQAGANDVIIFFYSGHGYQGGFYLYDGRLSYDKIRKAMSQSKCNNKLIFADACFSGKLRQGSGSSSSSTSTQELTRNLNVMLFLSSRDNETSIESPNMKNGFFTTYLVEALRGHADANRDSLIVAKELFKYVHDGVIRLSNDRQHPVMYGKFSDNMVIMNWKKNRKNK